jgi:trans-L-3-hydroxyproline dehydratase
MALHYKKGDLHIGEEMKIESITGSIFTASVVELVKFGEFDAVIPRVEGTAFITGQHEFLLDPEDPFQEGFFLR